MADASGNNRVTLAIVQNDIRHLTHEVTRRFDEAEQKREAAAKQQDEIVNRLDQIGERVTRNEERIGTVTKGLVAFQAFIGAAVAGVMAWLNQS